MYTDLSPKQVVDALKEKGIQIERQTYIRYENGAIETIPYPKLNAIADVLNVHPSTFYGWHVRENSHVVEDLAMLQDIMYILSRHESGYATDESCLSKIKEKVREHKHGE